MREDRSFVFTDQLGADRLVVLRSWVEGSVTAKVRIASPQARPGLRYEHSMGEGANEGLPTYLLSLPSGDALS